jgi:hypothetical protein
MKTDIKEYLNLCINRIEKVNPKSLLNGLGELVDSSLKGFVRTKLKTETIQFLKIYQEFPIL